MEYAGYKGIDSIVDYAGLTDKLATKVSDIGKERAKTKAELDQLASDSSKKLSEMEMTKTESLNDKLLALGNEGRDKIAGWNKDLKAGILTPSEYRKRMSGISEYTSLVGTTAKTFDTKIQEYIKRQTEKTGSRVELEYLDRFGMMTDLQNMDFKVLGDGRIAVDVKDPKTGKSIREEDLMRINKSEFIMTPRLDLAKEVNSVVKNWAEDGVVKMLGMGGYRSSASAMNDPKYKIDKQRLVDSLVEQNAISLLVDNGGLTTVNYAYNEEDKEAKLSEIIAKEKELRKRAGQSTNLTTEEIADLETGIIVIDNNGKPQLTDKQIDKARKIADAEIDLQVGNELKVVAPQPVSYSSTSAGEKARTIEASNAEGYKLSLDVMTTPFGANSSNNGYLGQLRNRALAKGENLYFERFKDSSGKWGIRAYPIKTTTVTTKARGGTPGVSEQKESIDKSAAPKVFMTAQQLSPYIWNENNAAEAQSAWKMGSQTEQGLSYYSEFQSKIQNKPKANNNKKFDAGKEANIKATMEAYPGATRADVIEALGY